MLCRSSPLAASTTPRPFAQAAQATAGGKNASDFRAVLSAWKPAHAVCESIKVLKTINEELFLLPGERKAARKR